MRLRMHFVGNFGLLRRRRRMSRNILTDYANNSSKQKKSAIRGDENNMTYYTKALM